MEDLQTQLEGSVGQYEMGGKGRGLGIWHTSVQILSCSVTLG